MSNGEPGAEERKDVSMPRIVVHDFDQDDERPDIAVYALDVSGTPLTMASVDGDGNL